MVESAVSSTAAEGMLQTAMPNKNKQSRLLNQSSGWKRFDEVSLFIISYKRCDGESSTTQTEANEVFTLRVRNIWVREGGKNRLFLSWFWLEAHPLLIWFWEKKALISIIFETSSIHREAEVWASWCNLTKNGFSPIWLYKVCFTLLVKVSSSRTILLFSGNWNLVILPCLSSDTTQKFPL